MCKKAFKNIVSGCCLILLGVVSVGWAPDAPDRIEIMKEEMARNFEALQKEPVPPYYMSYSIDDVRIQSVAGSFGAVLNRADNKVSYLRVEVRTGSYELDSSHEIRGDSLSALRNRYGGSIQAPINKSPDAHRSLFLKKIRVSKNIQKSFAIPLFPVRKVPTEKQWADVMDWMITKGLLKQSLPYNHSVLKR